MPTPPVDFSAIRAALATVARAVTGCVTILAEQKGREGQPLPRPALPYFTFKLTTPAARNGFDSRSYEDIEDDSDDRVTVTTSGMRRTSVSFSCYAATQEEAYELMSTLQSGFDQLGAQATLRETGIAVWNIGAVADLSQLLNTGYEARAQMDVQFGVAANATEVSGSIGSVVVEGTIATGEDELIEDFTIPPT